MEVTYLICNYNYGEWIKDSIKSVLGQTVKCNICIVDDCSTDDSVQVVNDMFQWEQETQNKYYIRKECSLNNQKIILIEKLVNDGPSESRNIGIEETIDFTDVYAILDADDLAFPAKTKRLLPHFEDENIGVVYADYYTENTETGNVAREFKRAFCIRELHRECIVHSGSFIRAEFLKSIKDEFGYYDKNLRVCEDYDLWLRLSKICMFIHHPEPLTYVKITPKNSTNSVNKQIWESCMYRVRQKCLK